LGRNKFGDGGKCGQGRHDDALGPAAEKRGVERRKGHSAVSISSCYKLTYLVEGFGGIGMVPRVSALLTSSYWAVARPDQGHFFNICNLDQSSSTLFNITTSVFLCQDFRTTASISSTIPAQSRI
jgi:hypothetical protein